MLDNGVHVDNVILSETLDWLVVKLGRDRHFFKGALKRLRHLVFPQQNLNTSLLAERSQKSGLVDIESFNQRVHVVLLQGPVEVVLGFVSYLSPQGLWSQAGPLHTLMRKFMLNRRRINTMTKHRHKQNVTSNHSFQLLWHFSIYYSLSNSSPSLCNVIHFLPP